MPVEPTPAHEDVGSSVGKEGTLSEYRNKMVFVASFAVSQRDMWESVMCVTGTEEGEWKVTRFEEAKERVKMGDRSAFWRILYMRYFYDDEGLFEKTHGLDNEKLGLEIEDLDEAMRRAIELVGTGYWEKYGKN